VFVCVSAGVGRFHVTAGTPTVPTMFNILWSEVDNALDPGAYLRCSGAPEKSTTRILDSAAHSRMARIYYVIHNMYMLF
jgi:hypothetical protein